jgi:hypothetical protein
MTDLGGKTEPDVSIFIGRSLWSIQIGPGNVVLNFCLPVGPGQSTPHTSISIEGPYCVRSGDSQSFGNGGAPKSAIALTELLLKDVVAATITANRDFEIVLDGGAKLLVIRDNGGFESFQISVPDGMYIFS